MSISKNLRYQVMRRDGHACRYCGRIAPDVRLTIDHVVPTTLGGTDDASNLITACTDCNAGKSATPPDAALVADVADSALRWTTAMRKASEDIAKDRQQRDAVRQDFLDAWNDWTYEGGDGQRHTVELPNSWPTSIDQLSAAGLGICDVLDAVDVAMRKERVTDTFRYFCGVAWRMVDDLQARTRELLDDPDEDKHRSLEGRGASCRIRCPKCVTPIGLALQIVAESDDCVKVRAVAEGDPWVEFGVTPEPVSLSRAIGDILPGPS